MNCIFICVFNNKNYVDMFYLLLESINIYGNLKDDVKILIYTSTEFMNMIQKSPLFNENIRFEINDTYNNIDKACKARLDCFKLNSINNNNNNNNINSYKKILYLDTDILIKDDIHKVFNVIKEDENIMYVLQEGNLETEKEDYHGKSLFGNELKNYKDKTAFTSGILLFNNCHKIKDLFEKINEDIIKRPRNFAWYDQPYIVYNAFKYNLFNNKKLKEFVVNNDNNINSNKVIHHFPGGPGIYGHKIIKMNDFLNKIKIKNNINKIMMLFINKKYTWGNQSITFLNNFEIDSFEKGYYKFINQYNIIAKIGQKIYNIIFNENYTIFKSIRKDNLEIIMGKII